MQQRLAHFSLSEANSESICFEQGKKINLCWIVWSLWVVLCTHYFTRTESTKGVSLWSFSFIQKKKTNAAPKDDLASLLKKDHQNYFFFFLLRYAVTINTRKMYYSTWLNESIVLITLTFKNVRISEESLLYYQQPQIPNIYHFYLENEFFKVAN